MTDDIARGAPFEARKNSHLRVRESVFKLMNPHPEVPVLLRASKDAPQVKSKSRDGFREEVVAAARGWIGTPYRHQASLRGVGCDCLGLVRGVWREVMGDEPEAVPAYSPDWAEASGEEALAGAALRHLILVEGVAFQAGDVVLFRWKPHLPAKHAGIATGEASMVHAQDGVAVSEVALSGWWLRRVAGVFRFPTEKLSVG
jgi:NlpC/P60 family putative phage cell wall peptidase